MQKLRIFNKQTIQSFCQENGNILLFFGAYYMACHTQKTIIIIKFRLIIIPPQINVTIWFSRLLARVAEAAMYDRQIRLWGLDAQQRYVY